MALHPEDRVPMDANGVLGLVLAIAALVAFGAYAFDFFAGWLPEALRY